MIKEWETKVKAEATKEKQAKEKQGSIPKTVKAAKANKLQQQIRNQPSHSLMSRKNRQS